MWRPAADASRSNGAMADAAKKERREMCFTPKPYHRPALVFATAN